MIHAFALEPRLVATWAKREEFRYFYDKFGLGTARVFLELPAFSKWKRAVFDAANELSLSQEDAKRIEELFRLFSEHKVRRSDAMYDGLLPWLDNAEKEHARKPFAGILATSNPRGCKAVVLAEGLVADGSRWICAQGATPARTPEGLADALSPMLVNCRELHLVDPHFGPENARHRKVLEALLNVVARHGHPPGTIRVHCSEKYPLATFEESAIQMATRLPSPISVEFVRWRQKAGGERLHNRYVLTDIGGASLGTGLDEGGAGQTDDVLLLPRAPYLLRWEQYVAKTGAFDCVDRPASVVGTRSLARNKARR